MTKTIDIKLLPSSVATFTEALWGDSGSLDAWLEANDESEVAEHIEAYASACVSSATAEKDAEIDALRTRLEDTVRDSTNKIETLRAEMEVWKASFEQAAAGHATYAERAERLAEALQLAEEHIGALTPEWYSAGQRVLTAIRAAKQPERDLP